MTETDKRWDWLIENNYFTESELQLVTAIDGYSLEILDDVCYARYGQDYESLKGEI